MTGSAFNPNFMNLASLGMSHLASLCSPEIMNLSELATPVYTIYIECFSFSPFG